MKKIAIVAVILPLLFAPQGLIWAQEAALPADQAKDLDMNKNIPTGPIDEFFDKWIGQGLLKEKAQEGMGQVQSEAEKQAGQALEAASQAAKDEASRQAGQAVQGAQNTIQTQTQGIVSIIKKEITNIILQTKVFFKNIYNAITKRSRTY